MDSLFRKVYKLEELKKHYDKSEEPMIQKLQKYDQIVTRITRRIESPLTNHFNWQSQKNINFVKLFTKLQEVSHLLILFDYNYHSNELVSLNELLQYEHSSLKSHLLLITTLIVQDYLREVS